MTKQLEVLFELGEDLVPNVEPDFFEFWRGGIKTTPAMACGLTDRVLDGGNILELMDPETLLQ